MNFKIICSKINADYVFVVFETNRDPSSWSNLEVNIYSNNSTSQIHFPLAKKANVGEGGNG